MNKYLPLLFFSCLSYLTTYAQLTSPDKMDEYMQALVKARNFNGTVLVAKNGQIIYQKAFGYADYNTKASLTIHSMFDLASVSKQFTAMSILLLKEQGKLSLSDSLRKFFPQLPYGGITIRHLLTHTSGLPEHFEPMEAKWDHKKVAFNPDLIRFLAQEKPPIQFKPGTKWEYSNTGYALLASIVENVSGQSFAQFTAQRIFNPLTMSRSRIYNTRRSSTEVIPDYAYDYVYVTSLSRYVLSDSLPNHQFLYYFDGIVGDGTVNSTVGDLLKWDRALKNYTLLPEATQQEMLSGQVLTDTLNQTYYGYGVFVGKRDNRDYLAHGGAYAGYRSNLTRYPADDVTVIVLSNNASNPDPISNALADILFGKPVMMPRYKAAIQVDEKILERYVGEYQDLDGKGSTLITIVTREGSQLFLQRPDRPKRTLLAETQTKFFFKEVDAQIEFIPDSSGQVVKRIITQNGQTFEAKKIK